MGIGREREGDFHDSSTCISFLDKVQCLQITEYTPLAHRAFLLRGVAQVNYIN